MGQEKDGGRAWGVERGVVAAWWWGGKLGRGEAGWLARGVWIAWALIFGVLAWWQRVWREWGLLSFFWSWEERMWVGGLCLTDRPWNNILWG